MGNCMETCIHRQQVKRKQERVVNNSGEFAKQSGFESAGGMRIKIVLRKEELDWLLLQLEDKKGRGIEDLLGEIERGRAAKVVVGWKPSLDSIGECPEVLEMER